MDTVLKELGYIQITRDIG